MSKRLTDRPPAARRRLTGDVLRAVATTLGDPVTVPELEDPRLHDPATARYLAEAAAYHNILPLLWACVERQQCAEALTDQVRELYRPVVAKALLLRQTLDQAVRALDAAGVRYAVFKGPAMWRYYREPRLRVGVDIDILIAASSLRHVRPTLRAVGFLGPAAPPPDRAPGLAESEYHLPGLGSLDVHWHVMREARVRNAFSIRTADQLARAQRVTLDGRELPVLDDCDAVIAVATHACFDGAYKLGWLVDLGLALRSVDARELRQRCMDARVELPVAVMLDRLRLSLGVESQGVESQGVESQGVESQGVESQGVESHGVEPPAVMRDDAWRAALRLVTRVRPVARSFQQPLRAGVVYRSTQHDARSSGRQLLSLIGTEVGPQLLSAEHRIRQARGLRDRAGNSAP